MNTKEMPGEHHHPPDVRCLRKLVALRSFTRDEAFPLPRGLSLKLPPTLRSYQHEGIARLYGKLVMRGEGVLLADEMGLGKTVQTLVLYERLLKDQGPMLVVAPKSACPVWEEEAKKWVPGLPVLRLRTGKTKAIKAGWATYRELLNKPSVVVINYEMLKDIDSGWTPGTLVLDECHYAMNVKSKRGEILHRVARGTAYRLGLSATPFWSKSMNYWNVLTLLTGPGWGSRSAFAMRYAGGFINQYDGLAFQKFNPIMETQEEYDERTHKQELAARLSYYQLRRTKKEVAPELPALNRQVVWVEGGREASVRYGQLKQQYTMARLQAALRAAAALKHEAAIELASQAGRFLLCTHYREHAYELHRLCEKADLPVGIIHGGISEKQRKETIARVVAEKGGLVATTDTLFQAMNLQHVASVGILHCLEPLPAVIVQLEARLHRINTTEPVMWYHIAAKDSADERVVQMALPRLAEFMQYMQGEQSSLTDLSRTMQEVEGEQIDGDAWLREVFEKELR